MDEYIFNVIIANAIPAISPAADVSNLCILVWSSVEGHLDIIMVLIDMHIANIKIARLALCCIPTIVAYTTE